MAYATHTNPTVQGFFGWQWLSDIRADLAQRLAQHRLYSQTRRELSLLSDRELSDLGINRSDIHAISLEAAQDLR
jgi:uncharacterized protein YjiS (DUF1127 family)